MYVRIIIVKNVAATYCYALMQVYFRYIIQNLVYD